MYESNTRNANLLDLTFDGDQRLIYGWRIYPVNDDIVFRLNTGSIIYIYTNQM